MATHMDATGALRLQARLENQEHWRRAEAVTRGEQPRVDPDAAELEEIGDGTRLYSTREEHRRLVDGVPSLVIERMTKRLVCGSWHTIYEVERVRPLVG